MNVRSRLWLSSTAVLTATGLAGCASSPTGRALYSDPGQFESLASGPYELVRPQPVVETPEVPVVQAPMPIATPVAVSASRAPIDGAELISQAEVYHPATSNHSGALATVPAESVMSPELAYATILRGNERFVGGITRGERRDEARRRSLASTQTPHTIVLSCSDSRVPPELIFDQGLGDIYTIRVSGNVLGSAQVASIETAVEKHGAKLIVVMGHESCETVQAAVNPSKSSGSTDQKWLASEIRPHVAGRGLASVDPGDTKLRKPVMANVDAVTEQLLVRSKIVGDAVQSGRLKISRGIYSLDSGRVDFWGK